MTDRKLVRLSATLLFVGVLLSLLAGYFHPDRENANNHVAAFAEYASSANWTAVHLGQFVGMAVIVLSWVIGSEGFSATNKAPTLLGILLVLAWSIWLLIIAWRMRESAEAAT